MSTNASRRCSGRRSGSSATAASVRALLETLAAAQPLLHSRAQEYDDRVVADVAVIDDAQSGGQGLGVDLPPLPGLLVMEPWLRGVQRVQNVAALGAPV